MLRSIIIFLQDPKVPRLHISPIITNQKVTYSFEVRVLFHILSKITCFKRWLFDPCFLQNASLGLLSSTSHLCVRTSCMWKDMQVKSFFLKKRNIIFNLPVYQGKLIQFLVIYMIGIFRDSCS